MLILGTIAFWLALFKVSHDEVAFWLRGEAAIVLPIDKYETKPVYKTGTQKIIKTTYIADLTVRLNSGKKITIPRQNVSKNRIDESHQREISIVLLPYNPETFYYPDTRNALLGYAYIFGATFGISFISFLWFRKE
jgi:hypothetical protein